MNEVVVSQSSGTLTDVMGSDVHPAEQYKSGQPSEQHKSRNARTATINTITQPIEPREHRRPHRPGIVWAAGSRLEARDFLKKWYRSFSALHTEVL